MDFLRGIAVFILILLTALNHSDYRSLNSDWLSFLATIIEYGDISIYLFFVISGFCIHSRAARGFANQKRTEVAFTEFIWRRQTRLYPTYFVALSISCLLLLGAYFMQIETKTLVNYPEPKLANLFWDFMSHAFMVHGFHPAFDRGAGNAHLWAVARFEYFYLLYFPLLFIRRFFNMYTCAFIVSTIGTSVYLYAFFSIGVDSPYWLLIKSSALVLWITWVAGALAAEIHYGILNLHKVLSKIWWFIPLYGIALILSRQIDVLSATIWAAVFFVLIHSVTEHELHNKWPQNKLLKLFSRIGIFSYSLFLIHYPVQSAAKFMLRQYVDSTNPFIYLAVMVALILISLMAGLVLFYCVERRFHKKPRQAIK